MYTDVTQIKALNFVFDWHVTPKITYGILDGHWNNPK